VRKSRLALVSDIHGNGVALDAVIDDMSRYDIDEAICLGDVAAGGPHPREVVARIRELEWLTVRGNGERWLVEGLPSGRGATTRRLADVVAWARESLGPDVCANLAALPATLTTDIGGATILACHGSPRSDVDAVVAGLDEARLDELLGKTLTADALACGHTHVQLLRRHDELLLINPGSVGLPLGSLVSTQAGATVPGVAEYAIVGAQDNAVEVTFRRLPIDVEALAAATAPMPSPSWAADLERRIARWNRKATDAS
jgi:putative phosphoesterase